MSGVSIFPLGNCSFKDIYSLLLYSASVVNKYYNLPVLYCHKSFSNILRFFPFNNVILAMKICI